MEIKFRTKEESNREAEEAFLKLPPAERFFEFLRLCYELKDFPCLPTGTASKESETDSKNNFEIVIKDRKNVDRLG